MKLWRKAVLFYLGGCGYLALELLWRGWSDGTMFLAGGFCFLMLGHLRQQLPGIPGPVRGILGAALITAAELLAGLAWNRSYAIWDYRGLWGNVAGQICPLYSLLWIPVALGAMGSYGLLDRRLKGSGR